MITLPGYSVVDIIYSSLKTTVYRGIADQDKKPVIIKVFNNEYPSQQDLAKIRREYEIARELDIEGILYPIDLMPFQQSYALVLEDFGGKALDVVMKERQLDMLSCLKIALKLAEVLGEIHQKGIIHKDIKPSNIIMHERTGEVKLTDFSIASRIYGEKQDRISPDLLEGTLAYISPEQTGRMNRSIDHRTDLYSLGVVIYEMLTGVLPFRTRDAVELIHCHMAVTPKPPRELRKDIPQPLSDIIMKLLAKNTEERYSGAFGLHYDLERCFIELKTYGVVEHFNPGTMDVPAILQIPEKLYGREEEIAGLMSVFSRIALGKTEIILVRGSPGTGKSVLINELHKPVIGQNGYFAAGKFDQFKRDVPYSALRQAFQDLIRRLLGGQAEKIAEWQAKIMAALGSNGQIIVDLIPETELIIGKQIPVEPLPPVQSQNRFNMVFIEFVRVFACREHPLVLSLDDIQWADWATLKLVEQLTTSDMHYLLVIGAYRDNEVGPAHPLTLTMDAIIKSGVTVKDISLNSLPVSGIIEMLNDTFFCTRSAAEGLADVVITKTHGNPFFVNQFLRDLYRGQMIRFNTEKHSWEWNIEAIRSADITSNVIEFLCKRIMQLSPSANKILTIAACIGNKFDLELLARVSRTAVPDTVVALHESQKEGLLAPIGVSYKYVEEYTKEDIAFRTAAENRIQYMFLHDRIQQAAYSLISGEEKKKIHYQVGKIMLEQTPAAEREERLFEIVQHLNMGADRLVDPGERVSLAGSNLEAGRNAKAANAYGTALQFAGKGLALLEKNSWQENYELYRNLSMEKAECDYLAGNFDRAESILANVLENVRTDEERARVYDLKAVVYALGNLMESVRAGLAGLRLLGINIPETPGRLQVSGEFCKAFLRLRGRKAGDLLSLPEMTDQKQRLVIRLIMNTISTAYLINQELFEFLCLKGFNLTLKYGVTESSPYMLHTYAFALADNFGAYKSAYDFGKTAFIMNEKFPNAQMRSKITCLFGFFFSHWRKPLKEGADMVKKGFNYCVETGDLVFAGYSACTLVIYMLVQGKNIDEILNETEIYQDFITRAEDQFSIDWYMLKNQFIKNLKGQTKDRCSLSDSEFDEERAVQGFMEQHNANLLFHYYTWKGLVLYLNNEPDEAYRMFSEAEQYTHGVALLPSVGDQIFYHTLTVTALYRLDSEHEQSHLRRVLRKNRKKIKKWSLNSPATFLHKHLLVEAETARIQGRQLKAFDLYSRAIAAAKEHGFVQVEALANELMALFHFSADRQSVGQMYVREACKCYHRWGAAFKVRDLSEKHAFLYSAGYPHIESRKIQAEDEKFDISTSSESTRQIDLVTVLRASQAISEEIVLGKLLQEIMHMAIQNAGAQKGFLILEKDDKLFIEAEGHTGKEDVEVLKSITVESSRELSAGIVNYVNRTMETVVLQDASREGLFVADPYVVRNRSKSILCFPIIKQKKVSGILYLENDLLTNAFTRGRLEVLSLLAAQAAISLENAKLYEDVEQRFNQLQQAEKQIRASLKEKEVLLREIHHRVKNNMQIISSLLSLQSRKMSDKKDADMLEYSQGRIKSMALVHEKLYRSKDLSHIDFGDYIHELTKSILRSYGIAADKIKLKIDVKDIYLGVDSAIPCGLIIHELVSNALKHAFPESRDGEITIAICKINEEELELLVSDNGIGIPADLDFKSAGTLGLQLVITLSENQLQGSIELDRSKGTEFRIRFKEKGTRA